jgi:hypothetical protein
MLLELAFLGLKYLFAIVTCLYCAHSLKKSIDVKKHSF